MFLKSTLKENNTFSNMGCYGSGLTWDFELIVIFTFGRWYAAPTPEFLDRETMNLSKMWSVGFFKIGLKRHHTLEGGCGVPA